MRTLDEILGAWPGGPGGHVDGIPLPRTGDEVLEQIRGVQQVLAAVEAGAVLAGDHDGQVQRLAGMLACGSWALGAAWTSDGRCLGPATALEHPVTGASLTAERDAAAGHVERRGADWPWALGVLDVLHWVTGVPGAARPDLLVEVHAASS